MNEQQINEQVKPSRLELITKDLKLIVERGKLRLEGLSEQKVSTDKFIETEAGRLCGEMCQVVEQYGETNKKGHTPNLISQLENLIGEEIYPRELKAIRKISKSITRGIKAQNKGRWILADEFSSTRVNADKLTFALMILANSQKEKVTILQEQIEAMDRERQERLNKQIQEVGTALTGDRKPLGGSSSKEANKKRAISVWSTARGILVLLAAIGLVSYGITHRDIFQKVYTNARDFIAENSPLGIHIKSDIETQRRARWQQYEAFRKSLVGTQGNPGQWPERTTANIILRDIDHTSGRISDWKTFVEVCGAQCFLDEQYLPGDGKQVVMQLLGITSEKDWQDYQQHPEKLPSHLRSIYPPEQWWLAELFEFKAVPIDFEGKSPFEQWLERHPPAEIQLMTSEGIILSMLGKPIIKNSRGRPEQRLDRFSQQRYLSMGRGPRPTKGFA